MQAARPVEKPDQYLTFHLGDEEYAVGILQVREILEYGAVTRVPSTPPWIRGVINVRGSVVPVIDLAVKFGLPAKLPGRRTCILLTEVEIAGEPIVLGVVADAVSQVVDLLKGDIEPPPAFGTRVHIEYLLGMVKLGDKFALLLDIDRVLSTDELLQVGEVPEAVERVLAASAESAESAEAPAPPAAEAALPEASAEPRPAPADPAAGGESPNAAGRGRGKSRRG